MRTIRVLLAAIGFAVLSAYAASAVALEWILRDIPKPVPRKEAPALAHRGLACVCAGERPWVQDLVFGSPEAQQVARMQALPSTTRPLSRLMLHWALSVWLDRRYDEEELLRLSGDGIYLGRGAYGLEAGSRAWFGKRLSELSLAQAAVLVGLAQSSQQYDPLVRPDRALKRRQVVLRAWERCGLIPAGTAASTASWPMIEGVQEALIPIRLRRH